MTSDWPPAPSRGRLRTALVVLLATVAAGAGVLLTAANRLAAPAAGACRDTVYGTVAGSCAAPQSPWWALVLGALVPAGAVVAAAAALGAGRGGRG
jgi:hypothetical protein